MKKVFFVAMILMTCLASCEKYEDESKKLAGTYYGVFSNNWHGSSDNDRSNKEDAPVRFEQNTANPANLILEDVADLSHKTKYRYELDTTDSLIINKLVSVCAESDSTMCGTNTNIFRSQVNRVKIDAHFGSSDLAMKVFYLDGDEHRAFTEFTGTRR